MSADPCGCRSAFVHDYGCTKFARPAMTAVDEPPRCIWCGTDRVNWWTSWNVTGEWTCDGCTPPEPHEDDDL